MQHIFLDHHTQHPAWDKDCWWSTTSPPPRHCWSSRSWAWRPWSAPRWGWGTWCSRPRPPSSRRQSTPAKSWRSAPRLRWRRSSHTVFRIVMQGSGSGSQLSSSWIRIRGEDSFFFYMYQKSWINTIFFVIWLLKNKFKYKVELTVNYFNEYM